MLRMLALAWSKQKKIPPSLLSGAFHHRDNVKKDLLTTTQIFIDVLPLNVCTRVCRSCVSFAVIRVGVSFGFCG